MLLTASCSHGLIHIYELAVPALLILIQSEFVAGDLALGRVVALYGFLFGAGSLPAGWLVDRLGSRHLLALCLWGAALSAAGMALAPTLGWFAVAAATMGLSLSIYHPAGTALITHALPNSGRIFAVHGMSGNLGVATSSVIAGSLGALFGWRAALLLLALAGVALGWRVLSLETPSLHEVRKREGRGRWPQFIVLLLAMSFIGMVYRGMTTFLPKLFALSYAREGAAGTAVGGLLTTLALLVGLVGMYVAGRAIDRGLSPARTFLIGALVQAPFLLLVSIVGPSWLLPVMMSVAFFHFFTQPPGNMMVADFIPPRIRGLGYGIYFFVSFGAGSFGAAYGGWVSERHGLTSAFSALAWFLIPAVAAALLLVTMRTDRSPQRADLS